MATTNKRLDFIARFVTADDVVGDIGSDHGYLPLALNKAGHDYVYASDNKSGPFRTLKKATSNLLHGTIEVALVDGIKSLPPNVNTLILSGMGGTLIKDILLAHPENLQNIHKLILAPHKAEHEVRAVLDALNFKIVQEAIIKDDKFYEVIVAKRGRESLNAHEIMFGPRHLERKSPLFIAKWSGELTRINNLLANEQLNTTRRHALAQEALAIGNALKEKR